jgi:predicted dienelactone hydrolase
MPVVIFSHGIGEDRESYSYLGRALASAGFVAVHITHAGTDRAVLERGYRHLYRATKDPINWTNRPVDVSFVIDRLAMLPFADVSRVAVGGHSAGAFTAFAVAGMTLAGGENFRDERVRAIVAMSMPRIDRVVAAHGYERLRIPVLNVTGTCDASLIYRTWPRHRRIPFELARRPDQYLVTLRDVNHNTFSNREDEHHALVAELTIAFARAFLLGDAQARAWFDDAGRTETLTLERKQ